ncbi:pirin family protein [Mangrovitalea sediminis]|uniref:pirin family protein n=1 Tax=Mangrovitalea sediminis TaxID=1982043 RepID=UPI000BE4D8A2|nr:pirin family protein [Mangrovitalea sediminis]
MSMRPLQRVISGMETSDGAGVRLKRSLGQSQQARLDPFLMLDEFYSADANDYIAGFPAHPHRGFETVTYMLDGHMLHEDHLGNRGNLRSGGVQWMTAGRGIIHSEMPQQSEGLMRGFQLWINLPAAEKMKAAGYRDIPAEEIPVATLPEGGTAKVIAGSIDVAGDTVAGPVQGLSTEALYVDLNLPPDTVFETALPGDRNAFVYAYDGSGRIGQEALPHSAAGVLGDGDSVRITAGPDGLRALLLAGKPLREPVAQYGPFVMNTVDELEQALQDYRDGTLTD